MKQEVRIMLDVTIELDAKYSTDEIRQIIFRNIGYRNNNKIINILMFKEEADIYAHPERDWIKILPVTDG